MGYPLQAVVSDDNSNIYETAKYAFPNVTTQLCHLHYLRNIHYLLDLDENLKHREFIKDVRTLFFTKQAPDDFDDKARNLLREFQADRTCVETLINIASSKVENINNINQIELATVLR